MVDMSYAGGSVKPEYSDSELVSQAKAGNLDAFDELIMRHRGRAYEWARRVIIDPQLAEDVVQDALIRAFLHLGSLMDMNRFLPWFQRIVQNQALKKVRRGGHYAKERPFSSFEEKNSSSLQTDWGNIDNVLHYMSQQYVDPHNANNDPSMLLAKGEIVQMIQELLHCLSKRERSIFEAHFFGELSPPEIAKLFDTTTVNVYKLLSRSKQKIQLEKRYYISIQEFVAHKSQAGELTKVMLDRPKLIHSKYIHPDLHVAHCIYHAVSHVFKDSLTFSEFMGRSGYAFQLNIELKCVSVSGLGNYHWDSFFTNGMLNLGLHSRYIFKFGSQPAPADLQAALNIIRESVDRGIPSIVMEGLIYGYDDQKQQLFGISAKKTFEVAYSQFGRGSFGCYVYVCEDQFEMTCSAALYRWLRTLIEYSTGKLRSSFGGHIHGLMAFEAWIHVFENRAVDVLGNASTILVVHDARNHAVESLRLAALQWGIEYPAEVAVGHLLSESVVQYAKSAEVFRQLNNLFPFPSGGTPNEPYYADAAIILLSQARDAEQMGIAIFEQILLALDDVEILTVIPETVGPSPFQTFGGWELPIQEAAKGIYSIQFHARIIRVSQLKSSIRYYSSLLDIPITYGHYDSAVYTLELKDGTKLLLEDDRDPKAYEESPICIWITNQLEQTLFQVQTIGWTIIQTIVNGPGMRYFVFQDHDYNVMLVSDTEISQNAGNASAIENNLGFELNAIYLYSNNVAESIESYEQFLHTSVINARLVILPKQQLSAVSQPILQLVHSDIKRAFQSMRHKKLQLVGNLTQFMERPSFFIKDLEGNIIAASSQ
jgi:RNA polymerase sigma factor (sigma-70 family)